MLKRIAGLTFVVSLSVQLAAAQADNKFPVAGFGGCPISKQLTSMWLSGPLGSSAARPPHPLIMVYFHGPDNWHDTEWKVNSNFGKNPGWAEFKSTRATLRLWVDGESGKVEVQGWKFNLADSNTFLVVHVGELVEQVIPLGVFDIPTSGEAPAAVLLLRSRPDLVQQINAKIAAAQ